LRPAGSLRGMASLLPTIRPAVESDAAAIRQLIAEAGINPRDLDWRRFLVADAGSGAIACAQVRVHGGGSRELASVAVTAAHRGQGLGRAISEAAIKRELVRPLYLYCEASNAAFWTKFGFREISGDAVPGDLQKALRVARVAVAIYSTVVRRRIRIVVMRRADR